MEFHQEFLSCSTLSSKQKGSYTGAYLYQFSIQENERTSTDWSAAIDCKTQRGKRPASWFCCDGWKSVAERARICKF